MLKRTLLISLTALLLSAPALSQTQPNPELSGAAMTSTATSSGYAPVNGVEVYYQVHGEGEPLVLLHGGLGSIEMFGPVLSMLAETHQVIAIDLQAHGRTLPHDRPMTFENMATDIAELIAHFGLEKADIMGYSLGGGVALRTAIDHPEVVDKLVLVSTPFAFSGWHDYNAEGMKMMSSAMAEPMKQTPMYQNYVKIAPDAGNWAKALDQIGSLTGTEYDWSAEMAAIKAPTLLVLGDWDSVRTSHAVQFFELLGGGKTDAGWTGENMTPARLAVVPGQTHYTIFSAPVLAETVIPFLDAAPAAAPTAN